MLSRFQKQILLWRYFPVAVILICLLVLGFTIGGATYLLRKGIRQQLIQRDAEILYSVAVMQQLNNQSQDILGSELDNPADQFNLALQISQLKDVIAARLYDRHGDFQVAFPPYIKEEPLSADSMGRLQNLQPVAHYRSQEDLQDLFPADMAPLQEASPEAPLMEVSIPLHAFQSQRLLGIIQFLLDGRTMAREFAALDHNLLKQAAWAFLVCGSLVSVSLGWSFRRLIKTNRLLMERTQSLQHANDELATSARTSALGAVTAHLIHGLTNPLSGLQDYMAQQDDQSGADEEWRSALASTRRMSQLVEDATRVLTEEHQAEHYELGLEEFWQPLHSQAQAMADAHQVKLHVDLGAESDILLSNRQANLVRLILENILTNAIEATPAGCEVRLVCRHNKGTLLFTVTDQGSGIDSQALKKLFQPCASTKEGGSGIGLAICRQLASHLGAGLRLKDTGPHGSCFVLELPLRASVAPPAYAMDNA